MDPVSALGAIIQVCQAIKGAVEQAKRNKAECVNLGDRVARLSAIATAKLSSRSPTKDLSAVFLQALAKLLNDVNDFITTFNQKGNSVCSFGMKLVNASENERRFREFQQSLDSAIADFTAAGVAVIKDGQAQLQEDVRAGNS